MNIEKQIYLNTEQLQTMHERSGRAKACYGSLSRYGGVYFSLKAKTKVTLSLAFESISSFAKIYVDGLLITESTNPRSHFELTLTKGLHVFDVECATHGGFTVLAEGVGLEEDRRYFDRVGGHSAEGETVVYTSNGDRGVNAYRKTSSTNTLSRLSSCCFDDALYYDKANSRYTDTVRSASTGAQRSTVTLSIGRSESYTVRKIRSIAMTDGRTLEAGADYIVATVGEGGALQLLRVKDQTAISNGDFVTMRKPALCVVSAQRGSILIVQGADYVWTGYFFHAGGDKVITFGGDSYHYEEIVLCRNRYIAPSATIDEEEGTPIFYYRKESGELIRRPYESAESRIGYMESYHEGIGGGYMQYAGELQYVTA